jgi:Flp pilus assembly pilin Flp
MKKLIKYLEDRNDITVIEYFLLMALIFAGIAVVFFGYLQ